MEMSAIAAKNIANMAYHDWSNGFRDKDHSKADMNINFKKTNHIDKERKQEL